MHLDREKLVSIARGDILADLVIKNAKIINVFTKTIEEGNLAISDGIVIGLGDYQGKETIDLKGYYLAPGFIDGHVHIESSMLTPERYAEVSMPRGTTSIIADCHEIANVSGTKGIDFMLKASEASKQDVFMMIPSCVPATQFEHNGQILLSSMIKSYATDPRVKGLGEMMDYVGTVYGDADVYQKIEDYKHKTIDGHAPGLKGQLLNAYCLAGVETDHECVSPQELIDKVKRGMYIHLRQGSQTKNVADLLPGISPEYYHKILMCSDDLHPKDMVEIGHIDNNINIAIDHGIDPIQAISMATINICECYQLKHMGAIAPGYQADLVAFKDLKHIDVDLVFKKGELLVKDGKTLFDVQPLVDQDVMDSVHVNVERIDLELKLKSNKVYALGLVKNNIVTQKLVEHVTLEDGIFKAKNQKDLLKLAVIERHHFTKHVGFGLVKGYGLKNGAVAMTIAHDSHNIICLGDNDEDMMLAIQEIKSIGGGIVLTSKQEVKASLALKVAGLMSLDHVETVIEKLNILDDAINKLGVNPDIEDPFLQLAFLSLPVVPQLKVTDLGLFDVEKFKIIPIEVSDQE